MSIAHYRVTGMSCGHCEQSVRAEVTALPGIERVEISATTGALTVHTSTSTQVDDALVLEAVEEAGYRAERVA